MRLYGLVLLLWICITETNGLENVLSMLIKSAETRNGSRCFEHLQEINQGLLEQEIWAIKCKWALKKNVK